MNNCIINKDGAIYIHYGYMFGGKIYKAESIISKQDEKCFSCINFIGCNEPGDILCTKGSVDKSTILKCRKENWFKQDVKR
jgi:hypothetical protein